jgi:hypothetical protein
MLLYAEADLICLTQFVQLHNLYLKTPSVRFHIHKAGIKCIHHKMRNMKNLTRVTGVSAEI